HDDVRHGPPDRPEERIADAGVLEDIPVVVQPDPGAGTGERDAEEAVEGRLDERVDGEQQQQERRRHHQHDRQRAVAEAALRQALCLSPRILARWHGSTHPFTVPSPMPETSPFCTMMNSTITGNTTTTEPAISIDHE